MIARIALARAAPALPRVASLCCGLLLATLTPGSRAAGMKPVPAEHGMVVSVSALASNAGVDMMRAGGNAIDAAVATAFALAVVHPAAGNIGGGGFMLIRMHDGGAHFLDFRETAPAAATATLYQDAQGHVIPGLSTEGYKAAGVPGSIKGLVYAEQHYGRLGLARVMQPAIALARGGFALSYGDADDLSTDKGLARFADSKRIFQNNGRGWHAGDLLRQPELARTLERIAVAPDDFYTGGLARELADFIHKGGGLITTDDLARYQVRERDPIQGSYRGLTILSAPPPSSGGIALVEALNILEGFDLKKLGAGSAAATHLTAEAYRRAFYDRAQFLGDPDYSHLPVLQLTDKRYAAAWRASIQPHHASASRALERPDLSAALADFALKHPVLAAAKEHTQTTHFSVVDADGNAVAMTTTINDWYGSKVAVGPLGFILNDEMDDFTAAIGVPNLYGLIQGDANAIGPNKRPLSAMTPTMVLKDGKLRMVLGSPGGPTIITTVANVLINAEDFGMDIKQAVDAPRLHHQWLPDELVMDPDRFSPDTIALLKSWGHKVKFWDEVENDAECIAVDDKGLRWGGSDGRNENGAAVGY